MVRLLHDGKSARALEELQALPPALTCSSVIRLLEGMMANPSPIFVALGAAA